MKKTLATLAGCCLLSLHTAGAGAAEPAACQTARIGIVGWTDVVATSAVAATLLEELGYKTQETTASQQIIFAGISKNQIDFFLGYWSPAMDANIKPFKDAGQVRVMPRPSLSDAIATLAVPRYAAEAGLKTFADIAKFKDQLGGKIYGIEPGTGANTAIKKMIDSNQFGLGGFTLVESSEAAMLAAVQRANKRHEPIVFVGWKPHPMNIQMDLIYLTGSQDVFGPNEGAATVSVVTAPDYAQRCPNVQHLLDNLTFTAAQESALMEPIMAREDAKSVARKWLKANPAETERLLAGVTSFDGKPGAETVALALK
jgi:glycine betaine/proline transport system substrate-binding protein